MKLLLFSLILTTTFFSQTEKINEYLKNIEEAEILNAKCETEIKEYQIKEFGKVLPKIAGECEWDSNGCPVKIVKPFYPTIARKNRIVGKVSVEIFIDETGKVVYAKAIEGKKIFYRNAEKAAALSRYFPKNVCGRKVWQRKIILYNFLPN